MTEEIIIDGGRMSGIKTLRSKFKYLEQENKELKEYKIEHKYSNAEYRQERESIIQLSYYRNKYRSALEEIKELAKNGNAIDGIRLKIIDKINEVLNNE